MLIRKTILTLDALIQKKVCPTFLIQGSNLQPVTSQTISKAILEKYRECKTCLLLAIFKLTMRTNLLNWCDLVSISMNVVFYAFLGGTNLLIFS